MKKFLLSFAYTLQTFRVPEFLSLASEAGIEVLYDKEQAQALDIEKDTEGVCYKPLYYIYILILHFKILNELHFVIEGIA